MSFHLVCDFCKRFVKVVSNEEVKKLEKVTMCGVCKKAVDRIDTYITKGLKHEGSQLIAEIAKVMEAEKKKRLQEVFEEAQRDFQKEMGAID